MSATCPSEEQLVRFSEDVLDETRRAELAPHLDACTRCRQVLQALDTIELALCEPDLISHDFVEGLLALPETAPAPRRVWRGVAAAAAAAVVLGAVLLARDPAQPDTRDASAHAELPRVPAPETPTPAPITEVPALADLTLPALHRLVREAEPDVAMRAVARLGQLSRRESLPVLLEAVRRTELRLEATRALGALGDERAVRALEPLLQDPLVATEAREALVQVGGGKAAYALARAVEAERERDQLGLLIDALARANGVAGIRRLAPLLGSRDATRVEAARQAIRRHERQLLPHALEELAGRSPAAVGYALDVLDVLAPAVAVPALRDLLRDRRHRERAAHVLMRIDTRDAASALWDARKFASARQAFRLGGAATERFLLERLADGTRKARRAAIELLGRSGGSKACAALADHADDPALAPAVLLALGRIGGEVAVRELAALSRRPSLRRGAVQALGMTSSPAAVVELERLGRSTRSLRVEAQRALAVLGSAKAIEAIVGLDAGRRSVRSTERVLRVMDRDLVLATLDTLLGREPPIESRLASVARRVRHAVGGPARAGVPRVALN